MNSVYSHSSQGVKSSGSTTRRTVRQTTDWFRFDAYSCVVCGDDCINDHRESCARYRECRSCHSIPVLDRGAPVVVLEPDLRWATSATGLTIYPRAVNLDLPETAKRSKADRPHEGGPTGTTDNEGGAVESPVLRVDGGQQ